MDISHVANHTVLPQFVAGNNYSGLITEVKDKPTGFTLRVTFTDISAPGIWHFNIAHTAKPDAQRIAMDQLKGLIDQIGEPIATTADLVGKQVTLRLTASPTSALPNCGLPTATDVKRMF
jgi:hypothetical protein